MAGRGSDGENSEDGSEAGGTQQTASESEEVSQIYS